MRKRYVPTSYSRTMRQKLQRLSLGSMIVETYYKEMEMALVRANIEEETEPTMAHFLSGLNPDIKDVVELLTYVELDDLLHKAVQVEQQLKRKIVARRNSSNNFNQSWTNKSNKVIAPPMYIHNIHLHNNIFKIISISSQYHYRHQHCLISFQ